MKENSLDSHRGKVAESSSKAVPATAVRTESTASTNFDDDYNEWELGIGDLIIDLDADIEKNNDKGIGHNNSAGNKTTIAASATTFTASTTATITTVTTATTSGSNNTDTDITTNVSNKELHQHHHHQAALQQSNFAMSSGKNKVINSSSTSSSSSGGGSGGGGGSGSNTSIGSNSSSNSSGGCSSGILGVGSSGGNPGGSSNNVEHQATVDKGLKMKIKRTKPTKTSEAKHEIVKPDIKPNSPLVDGANGTANLVGLTVANVPSSTNSPSAVANTAIAAVSSSLAACCEVSSSVVAGTPVAGGKTKHASSKGRGSGHREKKDRTKEKDRDKDRGGPCGIMKSGNASVVATDVNLSPACLPRTSTIKLSNSGTINVASLPTATVNLGMPANVASLGVNSAGGVNGGTSTTGTGACSFSTKSASVNGGTISCSAPTASFAVSSAVAAIANTGNAPCSTAAEAVNVPQGSDPAPPGNLTVAGASVSSCASSSTLSTVACTPSFTNIKFEPKLSNVSASNLVTVKLEDAISADVSPASKRIRMTMDKGADVCTKVADCKGGSVASGDCASSPKSPLMETQDVCIGTSVGTITEPECLGPCEPGTTVTLEGIVWQETEGGVLVVNVTWRGKTYVGTLLDCTKHDWAPPRFCESPTSDVEARTPKGRGKRGRGTANVSSTAVDNSSFTETRGSIHSKLRNGAKGRRTSNSGFTAPPSPAKTVDSALTIGVKRKGRPMELELFQPVDGKNTKRSRSQSRGTPTNLNCSVNSSGAPIEQPSSPILIECPEPNCSKKYKHINGLRYHQTHAHHSTAVNVANVDDVNDDPAMKEVSSENDESNQESNAPNSPGFLSSEKNLRSSPRPFTGKVPAPPSTSTIDQKPTLDSHGAVIVAPIETVVERGISPLDVNADLISLVNVVIDDPEVVSKDDSDSVHANSGVLRIGQSVNPSTNMAESPGPTETILPASNLVSQSGIKVSSPLSNTMPVITPKDESPVASSSAPLPLSPFSTPIRSPTVLAPEQQDGEIIADPTSPLYHHHQFTHPSTPTALDCSMGAVDILNCPISHSMSPSAASGPGSPLGTCEKPKIKQEKFEKNKGKLVTSPITCNSGTLTVMTSPSSISSKPATVSPQVHVATHVSGIQTVPTSNSQILPPHIDVSPKLIQQNSNVTVDPLVVSPSLDCLKRERSKHRKKNRDRVRDRKSSVGAYGLVHQSREMLRVPSRIDANDKLNGSMFSKMTDLLGKDGAMMLPSGSADVPLNLNTASDGNTCNENVQSPAYSDISDANDSTSAIDAEAPGKDKVEVKAKEATETPSSTQPHYLGPYSVYYYGQPPYVVSPMSTQSPPSSRSTNSMDRSIKEELILPESLEDKLASKDSAKHWNEHRSPNSLPPSERLDGQERLAMDTSSNQAPHGQLVPPAPSHVSQHEFQLQQQQQKIMQQQYAYHYGYQYHYMEQAYHMQLKASEVPYKQHQQHQQYVVVEEKDNRLQEIIPYKEQKDVPPREKGLKAQSSSKDGDKLAVSPPELVKHGATVTSLQSAVNPKEREQGVHHLHRQTHSSSMLSSLMSSQGSSACPPGSKVEALSASLKEKLNENHQILKENIELKTQMDKKLTYDRYDPAVVYPNSRHEELMRYLLFHDKMDQAKGVEDMPKKDDHSSPPPSSRHSDLKPHPSSKELPKASSLPPMQHTSPRAVSSPKTSGKDTVKDLSISGIKKELVAENKSSEMDCSKEKKDSKVQEGQKPTMETQGPPPPTSSYAYMHPAYMQSPHYGPIPFDSPHSMYRGMNPMLMAGHYPGSPYLHPQIRYHVPQPPVPAPVSDSQADLSPKMHQTKALDLLQHHASQYYSSHKIHELQEHAIKSPGAGGVTVGSSGSLSSAPHTKITDNQATAPMGKTPESHTPSLGGVGHDRRSPPLQRHLHTHHHTHVGVGYPILGQYDPYGGKPIIRH